METFYDAIKDDKMTEEKRDPLVLAVTGGSGILYALSFLEIARDAGVSVHLIVSAAGETVARHELGPDGLRSLIELADAVYDPEDLAAPPASGSARWRAMVVLPCSMGTIGAIAHGISRNLIHRAADCFLKERRPLVLVPREAPLNRIHLENMLRAHDAGAVIFPAMPGFYQLPSSIEDLARAFAGRIADHLGIQVPGLVRWKGLPEE